METVRGVTATLTCVIFAWFSSLLPSQANPITFNFDVVFSSAKSLTSGNTSNLIDYSVDLVDGLLVHGSFSYDPLAAPTSTAFFGDFYAAYYSPANLSFSVPSLNFTNSAATAGVQDSIDPFFVKDILSVGAQTIVGSPPANHNIAYQFALSFTGPFDLFNSTDLPTSIDLAQFEQAAL